jgi:hypothetical protein
MKKQEEIQELVKKLEQLPPTDKKKVLSMLKSVSSNGMSRFYLACASLNELNTLEILKHLN